ncbi:MAG: response regulator transcription factor [Burkholderiales bacterium]|nr:response regulator transcription factor [Burkholderiales bacterium]
MRPTMIRDDPLLQALRPPVPPLPRGPTPSGWWGADAASAALVLFVGPGVRPDRTLCDALMGAGMRCAAVSHLAAAHAACEHLHFDALVVDVAALGPSLALGLAALRPAVGCPVLVAAAQPSEVDEIVALEHGALHYLDWPVAPRRLRAHLQALLRVQGPPMLRGPDLPAHAPPQPASPVPDLLRTAGWALDAALRELRSADRTVALTSAQCEILRCLASAAGGVVHRAELKACVATTRAPLTARSIDVYVHRLRRRLAEGGVTGIDIDCVRGRGYRLRSVPAGRPLS